MPKGRHPSHWYPMLNGSDHPRHRNHRRFRRLRASPAWKTPNGAASRPHGAFPPTICYSATLGGVQMRVPATSRPPATPADRQTHLNYRANIDAHEAGRRAPTFISVSAVGSLQARSCRPAISSSSTSSSTVASPERRAFSARAASPTSRSPIPSCPRLGDALRTPRPKASRPASSPAAASTSSWRDRNSRPARRATFTEAGAVASSA